MFLSAFLTYFFILGTILVLYYIQLLSCLSMFVNITSSKYFIFENVVLPF